MEARISAAQHALLLLLVASLGVAVLARPHPENRRFTDALGELETFRADFSRSALEQSLREQAEAQRSVPLTALQKHAAGPRGVKLQVAKGAPPLRPLTLVRLATLSDVRAHAQAPSTVRTGTADVAALGSALAWRLIHSQKPGPFVLTGVELATGEVGKQDVELERDVAKLRVEQLHAQSAVGDATKKLENEERMLEARRKKRLPWKVLVKSVESTKAAKDTLDEKTRALADAQQRYESAAQRAERPRKTTNTPLIPEVAIAKVAIEQGPEQRSTLEIPVALEVQDVPVPTLRHDSFAATRDAGLWDEVKDLDAERAIDAVRGHFNWHNRGFALSGIKFSGAAVLQGVPCVLPLLLVLLLVRLRGAAGSYSPFDTKVPASLPRVGFKNRALDCLVIIILPVLAAASAAASLILVNRLPVLPMATGVLCMLIGAYALIKLGELQDLIDSVVSNSFPPSEY
jgi:hypothetical protein